VPAPDPLVPLAEAVLRGDETAFDRFAEEARRRLFRFGQLMCGQREDAEDVLQETLLKAFRKLHTLETPAAVQGWLFRIARNACLMKRRKSKFAPKQELPLEEFLPDRGPDGQPRVTDWSALPEVSAMNRELREKLNEAIRKLPPLYRMALVLRDVEGLTPEEAGRALGVNHNVLKTRLHRARLAVRKELAGYLEGRK
jgi:RNA polymerase sigma-70 factor (ECF subfamily)